MNDQSSEVSIHSTTRELLAVLNMQPPPPGPIRDAYQVELRRRRVYGPLNTVIHRAPTLILGVDFDGTCVEHAFPLVGAEIGAAPWLKALADGGVRLVLWTMRSAPASGARSGPIGTDAAHDTLQDAVDWFKANEIALWGINRNPEQDSWSKSPKAYCHRYIDDAAHGCPLKPTDPNDVAARAFVDWLVVGPQLLDWAGLSYEDVLNNGHTTPTGGA